MASFEVSFGNAKNSYDFSIDQHKHDGLSCTAHFLCFGIKTIG